MSYFSTERTKIKYKFGIAEERIRDAMDERPIYKNTLQNNNLIRFLWDTYNDDMSAGTILRVASYLRNNFPEYDTRLNIETRANYETAYHEHFSPPSLDDMPF